MADLAASSPDSHDPPTGPADTVAFLLSKLGFASATGFAAALVPIGIEPRHAGLLRAVAAEEGQSQQALGTALGIAPSRVVALVDDLEQRELVERRLNPADRRAREIHLTPAGRATLAAVAAVGLAHEAEVCAGLDPDEHATLLGLLQRLADNLDLPRAVHPALHADPTAGH